METTLEHNLPPGFNVAGHRVSLEGNAVTLFLNFDKGEKKTEDITAQVLNWLAEEGFIDITKAKVQIKPLYE